MAMARNFWTILKRAFWCATAGWLAVGPSGHEVHFFPGELNQFIRHFFFALRGNFNRQLDRDRRTNNHGGSTTRARDGTGIQHNKRGTRGIRRSNVVSFTDSSGGGAKQRRSVEANATNIAGPKWRTTTNLPQDFD
jgi:hypothetical protein